MNNSEQQTSELRIIREFDAPSNLVFKMWTVEEYAAQWWGPKNFTAPSVKIDLRIGGTFLFCMRDKDGKEFWSTGEYKVIEESTKLVMTDSFADSEGNKVPASEYGMEGMPDELQVSITFEDIKPGATCRMTLIHEGIPEGNIKDMTRTGWMESFDKLDEALIR